MNINSPILTKKSWGTNITLGIVSMFSVAAIGFVGTTHAQNGDSTASGDTPTSKEDCKRDGWKQYGFKNQGLCIASVNAHGYGGTDGTAKADTQSNNWWDFDISGDNNVVNIIINYFLS